jgi:hypothetical protein
MCPTSQDFESRGLVYARYSLRRRLLHGEAEGARTKEARKGIQLHKLKDAHRSCWEVVAGLHGTASSALTDKFAPPHGRAGCKFERAEGFCMAFKLTFFTGGSRQSATAKKHTG